MPSCLPRCLAIYVVTTLLITSQRAKNSKVTKVEQMHSGTLPTIWTKEKTKDKAGASKSNGSRLKHILQIELASSFLITEDPSMRSQNSKYGMRHLSFGLFPYFCMESKSLS